mmetsp:Transcript_34933/g.65065  ORF Transcript_34933/g.65065 Transcript_34933/m.65065 type:complete len:465 (-) Transcript_34933:123-1517(-)
MGLLCPQLTRPALILSVLIRPTGSSEAVSSGGVLAAGGDVLMVQEFDLPKELARVANESFLGRDSSNATSVPHPGRGIREPASSLSAGLVKVESRVSANAVQAVPSTSFPQQFVDPRLAAATRRSKMACAQVLAALVVVAMAPILFYQGWWAFVSLSTLLLSLTVVQVAMKAALHNGLPYPYSLTAIHMLLTVLTAFAAGPPRPGELRMAVQTLPSSVAGGGAVLLHNVALTQASVSFVTMLGSCTPVVTYCLELALGSRTPTWKSAVPVIMACFGGALCVRGEHSSSLLAVLLVLFGCASRSVKSVWQQKLLVLDHLGPARLAAWGAVWTLALTLPLAAVWEGTRFFKAIPGASKFALGATLVSCVAAVLLNLSQWTSIRYLGPVMQHMFGNLQLVFVLILAAVWLDEGCTVQQVLGTVILVAGVLIAKASPAETMPSLPQKTRLTQVPKQGYQATGSKTEVP